MKVSYFYIWLNRADNLWGSRGSCPCVFLIGRHINTVIAQVMLYLWQNYKIMTLKSSSEWIKRGKLKINNIMELKINNNYYEIKNQQYYQIKKTERTSTEWKNQIQHYSYQLLYTMKPILTCISIFYQSPWQPIWGQ